MTKKLHWAASTRSSSMSEPTGLAAALEYHVANTLGWNDLRPLQRAAVRPICDGDDCLLIAPTAGGKTEAAVFPLLTRMVEEDWQGLSVIYLTPLKALLNNRSATWPPALALRSATCCATAWIFTTATSAHKAPNSSTSPNGLVKATAGKATSLPTSSATWTKAWRPNTGLLRCGNALPNGPSLPNDRGRHWFSLRSARQA